VQWVAARRQCPATVYEGSFGPNDESCSLAAVVSSNGSDTGNSNSTDMGNSNSTDKSNSNSTDKNNSRDTSEEDTTMGGI
jgi:hypothetical protein